MELRIFPVSVAENKHFSKINRVLQLKKKIGRII